MIRPACLGVLLLAAAVASAQEPGGDDAVGAKLKAAKDDYEKEVARLRGDALKELEKAEDAARAAGNRQLVERYKADRKAFAEAGVVPNHPAGTAFERSVAPARQKLEAAYKQAVTDFLKAKMDAAAEATELEMKGFVAAGTSPKTAARDAYPAGTIWSGQLRWNGDAGNHNYTLVVTERAGKAFKGIARLDYGPSGNPNKKSLYDVEGEVIGLGLSYKGDLPGSTGSRRSGPTARSPSTPRRRTAACCPARSV
jgi:hypothetical protein